ncbi:MAG: hypothetical protein IID51_03655 [Proteobacteria bacterium]|nr:hypothetical protein [Pseudomonadota bacterium]
MRFQPFIALALLLSGAFFAPALAQQDERFYGRWEPMSKGAADNILYIDPGGNITLSEPSGGFTVERYQVIRDFGKRVIVRLWGLGNDIWTLKTSALVVLEYVDADELTGRTYDYITYHYCSIPAANEHFFKDHDPDNMWRRILEWSARADEGFPHDNCDILRSGELLYHWDSMSWARFFDRAAK